MSESFVDLTYRGLTLGRKVKLTQVRPSSGILEHVAPMPVGTSIGIASDDGTLFDAVVSDDAGRVREIQVKREGAESNWIWGAFGMPGSVLHELYRLWRRRRERDEYIGTLVNAYLATGGEAVAVPAGTDYVDVGTLGGYREAMRLLADAAPPTSASRIAPFPIAPRPVAARRR